jgi:hypothetical protein
MVLCCESLVRALLCERRLLPGPVDGPGHDVLRGPRIARCGNAHRRDRFVRGAVGFPLLVCALVVGLGDGLMVDGVGMTGA